ncbi:MAG: Nif3-like dinuclear metal center hexameric protein [Saccharofermentans sp.]|nr:Nif3-like dinuclear metal center hexameric protein [Saccharofermentans sp.]
MQIKDVTDYLDEVFPRQNALDYDNPGLMAGDSSAYLSGIVLSLDCTNKAIDTAVKNGCNLLITHHPIIFGGIDTVCVDTVTGKLLSRLIKTDIACFACHTNLDLTDEFGNQAICEAIGAPVSDRLEGAVCGSVFELEEESNILSFRQKVSEGLKTSGIITINPMDSKVKKVFVQGGAFDEDSIDAIVKAGIDTVISGEIKHHITVMLAELGINTLIAGHSATEQIYLPKLEKLLQLKFPQIKFIVNYNDEGASVL